MDVNGISVNVSELVSVLPPGIVSQIGFLTNLLKAVGIAFLVYVLYLIIKMIVGFKNSRRLKFIEGRVKIIDKKIDLLLKSQQRKKNKKKE